MPNIKYIYKFKGFDIKYIEFADNDDDFIKRVNARYGRPNDPIIMDDIVILESVLSLI
ncbi:MAG: hypothetical protein RR623_10080 [Bacilli bacterium]